MALSRRRRRPPSSRTRAPWEPSRSSQQELRAPTPLPALIAGAPPVQRDDLYTLAFAVARADETVSGGERIFLAQLAHLLGLDAAAATELERVAVERIAGGRVRGDVP